MQHTSPWGETSSSVLQLTISGSCCKLGAVTRVRCWGRKCTGCAGKNWGEDGDASLLSAREQGMPGVCRNLALLPPLCAPALCAVQPRDRWPLNLLIAASHSMCKVLPAFCPAYVGALLVLSCQKPQQQMCSEKARACISFGSVPRFHRTIWFV